MKLRLALFVVLAALGAAPAAHAAAGIEIEVGEKVKAFTAEDLSAGDVQGVTYMIDGAPHVVTGLSLREALVVAGVNPATSSGITVHGAGGRRLQIVEPELADPWPFPEGPVVMWVEGDVTKVLLPVDDDPKARVSRVIASAPGEPLRLEPIASNVIGIGIAAPGEGVTAKVGERVTFVASGGGTGAGALEWRWDFRDGTTATGQEVRHAFPAAGTYRVVLTATGASDTATILVTVEDAEPEQEKEKEKEPTGSGGGGSGATGTPSGTGSTGAVTPSTSSSPAPASTPAASPEPERTPKPKPKREKPKSDPEPPAPELDTVEGVVLSPDAAAPVPAPAAQAAGVTPQEHAGDDGEGPSVPWVSIAIVLAFLSGLQAARVQRSRRLPPRR